MVHMNETDKDVLRFPWVDDIDKAESNVFTLRFTLVVFGLSSRPFLLNATIKHHIEQYEQCDPDFTGKFLESIYVDDLTSRDCDMDSTFELYVKSKLRLKKAGFNLRSLSPIHKTCGRVLMAIRDWFQEKQVLELEGMLTGKLKLQK